ncbi:MAG: response regulator [Chloroflexaceae bacterium]|jgi:DNA-binding NtrC family response regulator|nr:response regulator [Chloroflexaceae bacterium]
MERQPARILVVDDEAAIRLTMSIMLQRRGYAVSSAASSAEALALIHQHRFEMALLDLKLPDGSGLDLAEYLRLHHPATAVLILTGSSPLDSTLDDGRLGQFHYLIKTCSPQDVLERINLALCS